ncbi:TIR domain-containing protein [Amycolatopsis sp. WQ 127309]|uniref:TIR domain-containing protein n=1 Tax=Amycolatopsis sp. WQ 127309 TaxID=2932773 RepID=UPI001FF3FF2C|nr:TIR domain-containing protein [Amycolatopsis sp. WQ 127309]UOZ04638.1 TIR domain-containing protein [Amycolatopsis sp. WQ 127309]
MTRKTFFSFHFKPDSWRAGTVRSIGALDGNEPVSDNTWEQVKRAGDGSIRAWIAKEMSGKTCTVVLIGSETSTRKWVLYELSKAWNDGLGVFGVYIHNLKDSNGFQSWQGASPLDKVTFNKDSQYSGKPLSTVAKVYKPPFTNSQQTYGYIAQNIANWAEEAIAIRKSTR